MKYGTRNLKKSTIFTLKQVPHLNAHTALLKKMDGHRLKLPCYYLILQVFNFAFFRL